MISPHDSLYRTSFSPSCTNWHETFGTSYLILSANIMHCLQPQCDRVACTEMGCNVSKTKKKHKKSSGFEEISFFPWPRKLQFFLCLSTEFPIRQSLMTSALDHYATTNLAQNKTSHLPSHFSEPDFRFGNCMASFISRRRARVHPAMAVVQCYVLHPHGALWDVCFICWMPDLHVLMTTVEQKNPSCSELSYLWIINIYLRLTLNYINLTVPICIRKLGD